MKKEQGLYMLEFAGIFAVSLVGKLIWWLLLGTTLETDSLGYLDGELGIFHPPGYEIFAANIPINVLMGLQMAIFSFGVAFFMQRIFQKRWIKWLVVALLFLDPCMGDLGRRIMSESVLMGGFLIFLGLLLPEKGPALRTKWWFWLLLGGFLAGLWMTRYVAILMIPLAFVLPFFFRKDWRERMGRALLIFIGFQVFLVPVRIFYQQNYGVLNPNVFTGYSMWNASAMLFPGSAVKQNPVSKFEEFASNQPARYFQPSVTWNTAHIFGDDNVATAFLKAEKKLDARGKMALSREMKRTSFRLVIDQPTKFLTDFWWENLKRPFLYEEDSHNVPNGLFLVHEGKNGYSQIWWWLAFGLLCILTVLVLFNRKLKNPVVWGLLLLIWGYFVSISFATVLFLRFLYFLMPLILLAGGKFLELWTELKAEKQQIR